MINLNKKRKGQREKAKRKEKRAKRKREKTKRKEERGKTKFQLYYIKDMNSNTIRMVWEKW